MLLLKTKAFDRGSIDRFQDAGSGCLAKFTTCHSGKKSNWYISTIGGFASVFPQWSLSSNPRVIQTQLPLKKPQLSMVMKRATWQLCNWESGWGSPRCWKWMCIGKRGQGKEQLINMVMLAPKKLQLQGTFRKSFNILNIRLIRLLDYILDVHEMFMPLRSLKISLSGSRKLWWIN